MKVILAILLFLSAAIAQAQNSETCYERTYTTEHMAKNPMQSFSSVKLRIFKGEFSMALLDVVSKYDGADYQFAADVSTGSNWCAGFAADGPDYKL